MALNLFLFILVRKREDFVSDELIQLRHCVNTKIL